MAERDDSDLTTGQGGRRKMIMPQRRERVVQRLIEDEMRESFLDYSMSVIVQRALPDVRDGLKPVHRRILYAMHEVGLTPARPYKKSAAVVGEVLGKYHPHGDTAVYDALVRMVQDFSLRYPLVDGQGNFGSIDGDNAAAYRYTEARLSAVAMELLGDIGKDTVDFTGTFDDQRTEPVVLPSRLPNLLLNGSAGIAVGMATNIPPHNLREIAAAVRHLVSRPGCAIEELMELVPGPDFPTAAFIVGTQGIEDAYRTGRGRMVMRARVQKELKRSGKEQLVVTELPYGVSKTRVIEQIAELSRARKLEDVADLRDESDRDGMRIVVELKRGAKAQPVLGLLYKQTNLQATFGAIMLALDPNGVPREFNLKQILEFYRDHRLEVIRRRSRHDLERARAQAHIVQGLIIALDDIDAVIKLIRKARDRQGAAGKLRSQFELSEKQADAILDMRLHRLTGLERQELRDHLKALERLIADLEKLLANEKLQLKVLVEELDQLVEQFGDARRTEILQENARIAVEDLVAHENVAITVSHEGYINRVPMGLYRRRAGGGKPLAGMERYEDDFLEHAFVAGTHDTLVFFGEDGIAYALAVNDLPEGGRSSRGKPLHPLIGLDRKTRIVALVSISDFDASRALTFLTTAGTVKRTALDQFTHIRAGGIIAISLARGDRLLDAQLSDGAADVALVTRQGRAIRFPESEIPLMGRAAQGVRGMQLRKDDAIVGMVVVRRDATLCTVTEQGYAKRTPVADYPVQHRGGLGTVTLDVTRATGTLVSAQELIGGDELMVITLGGVASRLAADDVPAQGRATQGKRLIRLDPRDRVVEVARLAEEREDRAVDEAESRRPGRLPEEQLELIDAGDEDG